MAGASVGESKFVFLLIKSLSPSPLPPTATTTNQQWQPFFLSKKIHKEVIHWFFVPEIASVLGQEHKDQ